MKAEPDDSTLFDEVQAISQIIFGEPASKANSRRIVKFGSLSRMIKSQKALNYSDAFKQQCKPLATMMSGDLRVTMQIFYASRRPDLDESLILDLLQGVIYNNDRQVKEKHIFWGLDKNNPRAEIIVEKIPAVEQKKSPAWRGCQGEYEL